MVARKACPSGRKARPASWAALALLLWALPVAAGAAERVALVIGNSAYEHVASLANPGNDAKAVGDAFEGLGYTVTRLMDADFHALRDGVRSFKQAARGKEVAVVFYAGHGIRVKGSNFLVPVDAELGYADAVEDEAIPLGRLTSAVGNTRHLGLVILDACRNNPFVAKMKGDTRSIERGLARLEETTGKTMVAYAAKHGMVADDGDGTHSPYTEALLKYLREEPGLPVRELFGHVHDAVLAATSEKFGRDRAQEPWTYEALGGRKFYLVPAAPAGGGMSPSPSGDAARAYEAAERVGTVAAFRAIVKRFPGTLEAELAQAWIDKHEGAKEPLVVTGGDPVEEEPAKSSPEAVQQGLGLNVEARRLVQMGLAAAGHPPGSADGMLGPRTRGALRAWQASKEVEATGYLTREQSEALVALGKREEERLRARRKKPGTKFRDCPECPEMVVVPSGSFQMGSPPSEEGRVDNEGPGHRVTIGYRFAVGKYEVTLREFARFVEATGRSMGNACRTYVGRKWERRSGRHWRHPGFGQTDAHPVVCVDWEDARAYVRWLSRKTGHRYRLLSEAEWEYAARAGTTTRYSWGDGIGRNRANCGGCGSRWDGRQTAPVGSFAANGFGLYDVHGNVWEWVADCWNNSYRGAPSDGSAWESGNCGRRVLRGGSRLDRPRYLRSAYRFGFGTGHRLYYIGFRVARTLTP